MEDQLSAAQQILAEKKVEANKYNEDTAAVEQIVKKEESLLHKLFQEELKVQSVKYINSVSLSFVNDVPTLDVEF